MMFDSLLIANRGEIACRIVRTARAMGLRTVAVYSDADAGAPHVRLADQAVAIGPAPASQSYLCVDRILDAARRAGAQAIHPGYGFLSEQADLVQGCAQAGLTWVGPHLEAIRAMGAKIEAKQIAQAAGVPCIPGYGGADQSTGALVAAARQIGLPVMIKASAGGGGKGMRAVHDLGDLAAAIGAARTEAERAFGDGRLMVEKLIETPRHIEVQLLGDKHGNLVHLFERDCSVQRNHQKILEEAPAPNLRDATRAALYEAALKLGRAIGYDSVGTVEFVMNAATEAFYFLEMNTRLQVEHTVTEEITGIDLVAQQLRVAGGAALDLTQGQITRSGHAIEARLTAEDPAQGFCPATGRVLHWAPPPGLRCDSGIDAGSVVGAQYDSLIAKLIAHGKDRASARQSLVQGLAQMEIAGLATNRLFLRDALMRESFVAGRATTGFVPTEWPQGWAPPPCDSLPMAVLLHHSQATGGDTPWRALSGFRLLQSAGHPAKSTYVDTKAPQTPITVTAAPGGLGLDHSAGQEQAQIAQIGPRHWAITRDGVQQTVGALIEGGQVHLWAPGFDARHMVALLADLDPAQTGTAAAGDRLVAPMPGLIVALHVAPGDQVCAGQTLVVMESMKLLMELQAPADGTVAAAKCAPGQSVEAGSLLIALDI